MSNNDTNKKGKKSSLLLKILGVIILLACVFAAVVLILMKIQSVNAKNQTAAASTTDEIETMTAERTLDLPEEPETEVIAESTVETISEVEEEPIPEPEPAFQPTAPENEDGTGNAGLAVMDESIGTLAYENGWFRSALNSWYSPDLVHYYYGGWVTIEDNMYHFDEHGMLDRGWKIIGDQSCYFGSDGIYYPDTDPNKVLAFTFDDGPSKGTGELLDLCEQTGARISFFLVGNCTPGYGDVISRIIQDRCELGSHSADHTQMIKISTEECVTNFQISDAMIRENGGGFETDCYRFPYGDFTAEETAAVGKPSIMWSLDSLDWDLKDTQAVINRVLEQVSEGDIILMHDLYDTTIEACRYLFPYLQEQGYQLVTVRELAAAKGYELEAGKTYYSFSNEGLESGYAIQ